MQTHSPEGLQAGCVCGAIRGRAAFAISPILSQRFWLNKGFPQQKRLHLLILSPPPQRSPTLKDFIPVDVEGRLLSFDKGRTFQGRAFARRCSNDADALAARRRTRSFGLCGSKDTK